ncbi:MAG TPA: hypothetical protein VMC79_17085 [Rectinemataceae bacterium]|nr:hypothetical protein [Rectinemataceae bacterium]
MIKALHSARPRPQLAPSELSPATLRLMDAVLPFYGRMALHLGSMKFAGMQHIAQALEEFYSGSSRLILAFRHPYGDEPQLLTYALRRELPRAARRAGRPFAVRPHCLFLHGYEVPLWSGPLVRWILPRSGAMPIYHVRADGAGLRRIRTALADGAHPLALAPEGQSSYRSESLPRLERGAMQLGFWCAEDLAAAHRAEKVLVLPLSVFARHRESDIAALEALARRLERRLGIPSPSRSGPGAPDGNAGGAPHDNFGGAPNGRTGDATPALSEWAERRRRLGLRLRGIDLALLGAAEAYYGLASHAGNPAFDAQLNPDALRSWREERRSSVLETALHRGEAMLGLRAQGDFIERVYRIRHEGWNRIFPEEELGALAPLGRALADRRAGEAWYAMRHMELVDLLFYLDADYLESGLRDGGAPTMDRLVETSYNLADFASRLVGGTIAHRPNVVRRDIVFSAEPALEIRSRLSAYREDRRAALECAQRELAGAYEHSIKEFIDGA